MEGKAAREAGLDVMEDEVAGEKAATDEAVAAKASSAVGVANRVILE